MVLGAAPCAFLQEINGAQATMSDYQADIAKYTNPVNEAAVKAIVKYCGIALRNADSAKVSATDASELATVRNGFAAKKLGLEADAADAGIKKVIEKMKAERSKSRVTFYYLLAEATGTMGKLA
jgi:chaperone required for assembly of F1-ATPase